MVKKIFLVGCLLFTAQAFGYNCPDSTNLDDDTARAKCLYKILNHYKESAETKFIKQWQRDYKNNSNNENKTAERYNIVNPGHFNAVFEAQQLLDKHANTGVYHRLPYCPVSSSSTD